MTLPRGFRRAAFLVLALALLPMGSRSAMPSSPDETIKPPPETYAVPLRFARHNFRAFCYNTLNCRVVYDSYNFAPSGADKPSPAPSSPDYRSAWGFGGHLGIRNFPPPAEVKWTSLDGVRHEANVDIAAIFKHQLVWHRVPKVEMMDFYDGPVVPGGPDIVLEVKDRTINVYTNMLIPTRSEQIPGNKHANIRNDLLLAWTRTY